MAPVVGAVIDDVGDDISELRGISIPREGLILDPRAQVGVLDERLPGLDQGGNQLSEGQILDLLDMEAATSEPGALGKQNVLEYFQGPLAILEISEDVNPLLVCPQVIVKTAEKEVSHG